jgi:hypothetical protein
MRVAPNEGYNLPVSNSKILKPGMLSEKARYPRPINYHNYSMQRLQSRRGLLTNIFWLALSGEIVYKKISLLFR